MNEAQKVLLIVVLFFAGLLVSAISPKEYFTWFLETFPAMVAFAVLLGTYRRFRFTDLTYGFVLLNCYIIRTYAKYISASM